MKKGFTILELLVVMGVLSVILAIAVPAIGSAHTTALKKRARSEATMLAQAAMRYKAEYGFWPGQVTIHPGDQKIRYHKDHKATDSVPLIFSGPSDFFDQLKITFKQNISASDIIHLDSNEVYQAFSRVDKDQPQGRKTNPLNPRGIHFLDLKNEEDLRIVSFPDPWGNPYILFFGMDPKLTLSHQVIPQENVVGRISISNVTAFAFSFGPYGLQSTNYIYSAGVR